MNKSVTENIRDGQRLERTAEMGDVCLALSSSRLFQLSEIVVNSSKGSHGGEEEEEEEEEKEEGTLRPIPKKEAGTKGFC